MGQRAGARGSSSSGKGGYRLTFDLWNRTPEYQYWSFTQVTPMPTNVPPQSNGLRSKIRRVFRTSSGPDNRSFSLVSQLTSAALCASSPALPRQGDVPPVVKSLIRPLSVPQLRWESIEGGLAPFAGCYFSVFAESRWFHRPTVLNPAVWMQDIKRVKNVIQILRRKLPRRRLNLPLLNRRDRKRKTSRWINYTSKTLSYYWYYSWIVCLFIHMRVKLTVVTLTLFIDLCT